MDLNQLLIVNNNLQKRIKGYSSTFFFIAGLSIINTFAVWFNFNVYFPAGLGITLFIDALLLDEAKTLITQALITNIIISLVFVLFGLLAIKGKKNFYIIALVIYILDALILLLFQDVLGIILHAILIFSLIKGLNSFKILFEVNKEMENLDIKEVSNEIA